MTLIDLFAYFCFAIFILAVAIAAVIALMVGVGKKICSVKGRTDDR